jgi:hypothetical protein
MSEQLTTTTQETNDLTPMPGKVRKAAMAVSHLLRGRLFSGKDIANALNDEDEEPYSLDELKTTDDDDSIEVGLSQKRSKVITPQIETKDKPLAIQPAFDPHGYFTGDEQDVDDGMPNYPTSYGEHEPNPFAPRDNGDELFPADEPPVNSKQ